MKNIEGAENFNDTTHEQYQNEGIDQESKTKLTNESNLEENKKPDTSITPKIETTKQVYTEVTEKNKCTLCGYSTVLTADYNKHLKTKKHIINSELRNSCSGCLKTFSKKSNKTRHEKTCMYK